MAKGTTHTSLDVHDKLPVLTMSTAWFYLTLILLHLNNLFIQWRLLECVLLLLLIVIIAACSRLCYSDLSIN